MIGGKTIEHIVPKIGTEVEAQIPILISELRIQTHKHFRHRTLSSEILVGLRNFTIVVPIHYFILNRMSLVIIYLFIKVEGTRCMTYLMILDSRSSGKGCITGCNTRIIGIINRRQFRDTTLVPGKVVTQLPTEILCLNRYCIDIEFNPQIRHLTHIGGNDVGEVRTGRCTDTIEQVFSALVVILKGTRDTIVQETEIQT